MFRNQTVVYFDRSIIKRDWKRINRGPLQKAGNIIRMNARQSIRRAGPRTPPSKPGMPPRSRQPGRSPPFKMIYSVPQHFGTSVVIGMVGFGGFPAVPGLQEHGGHARRKVFKEVGRGPRGGIIRKKVAETVTLAKRPFMIPARDKALPRLPLLWRNSVSRPQ